MDENFEISDERLEKNVKRAVFTLPEEISHDHYLLWQDIVTSGVSSSEDLPYLVNKVNMFIQFCSEKADLWDDKKYTSIDMINSSLLLEVYLEGREFLKTAKLNKQESEKFKVYLSELGEAISFFKKAKRGREGASRSVSEGLLTKLVQASREKADGEDADSDTYDSMMNLAEIKSEIIREFSAAADDMVVSLRSSRFRKKLADFVSVEGFDSGKLREIFEPIKKDLVRIRNIVYKYSDIRGLKNFDIPIKIGQAEEKLKWTAGKGISKAAIKSLFNVALGRQYNRFGDFVFNSLYEVVEFEYAGGEEGSKRESEGVGESDNSLLEGDPTGTSETSDITEVDPLLKKNRWDDENVGGGATVSRNISDQFATVLEGMTEGIEIPRRIDLNPVQQLVLELIHQNVLLPILQNIKVSNAKLGVNKTRLYHIGETLALADIKGRDIFETLENVNDKFGDLANIAVSTGLKNIILLVTNIIVDKSRDPMYAYSVLYGLVGGGETYSKKLESDSRWKFRPTEFNFVEKGIEFGLDMGRYLNGIGFADSINWENLRMIAKHLGPIVHQASNYYKRNPLDLADDRKELARENPEEIGSLVLTMDVLDELRNVEGMSANGRIALNFMIRTLYMMKDDRELGRLGEPTKELIKYVINRPHINEQLMAKLDLDKEPEKMVDLDLLVDAMIPSYPVPRSQIPEDFLALEDAIDIALQASGETVPQLANLSIRLMMKNMGGVAANRKERNKFISYGVMLAKSVENNPALRSKLASLLEDKMPESLVSVAGSPDELIDNASVVFGKWFDSMMEA
jgi:hypothetical protein